MLANQHVSREHIKQWKTAPVAGKSNINKTSVMTSEGPMDGAAGCIGRPHPPSVQDAEMKKVLSAQACQVLAELRKTGELCDAIIKVGQ